MEISKFCCGKEDIYQTKEITEKLAGFPKVTQKVNRGTKSNAKLLAPGLLYFWLQPHWLKVIGQMDMPVLAEGRNKPNHLYFIAMKTASWTVVSLYSYARSEGMKPKYKFRALSATFGSFPPHSTTPMRCLHFSFPLLRMFFFHTSHLHPSVLPFGYAGEKTGLWTLAWLVFPSNSLDSLIKIQCLLQSPVQQILPMMVNFLYHLD